jgi:hypothetical protein
MRCAAFLAAVVFALPALAFDYGDIPINKAVRSNGYVVAFRDLITKSPAAVSLCGESSLIRPRDGEIHYFYEKDHIAHLAWVVAASSAVAVRVWTGLTIRSEKGVESAAKRRMNHEVERSPQDELLSDVAPVYNDGTGVKALWVTKAEGIVRGWPCSGGAANDS